MTSKNRIIQAAYVVDDLQAAMERWLQTMNVGPFYALKDVTPANMVYRGSPSSLTMHLGFVQAGPMQIELIQPLGSGPNVYRDSVPAGSDAFHHLCYFTDDFDGEFARYAAMDAPVACQASHGAMRFAYFDTRANISCMTEVMEHDPSTEGMFAMIANAAVDWDGRDPIRIIQQ